MSFSEHVCAVVLCNECGEGQWYMVTMFTDAGHVYYILLINCFIKYIK